MTKRAGEARSECHVVHRELARWIPKVVDAVDAGKVEIGDADRPYPELRADGLRVADPLVVQVFQPGGVHRADLPAVQAGERGGIPVLGGDPGRIGDLCATHAAGTAANFEIEEVAGAAPNRAVRVRRAYDHVQEARQEGDGNCAAPTTASCPPTSYEWPQHDDFPLDVVAAPGPA